MSKTKKAYPSIKHSTVENTQQNFRVSPLVAQGPRRSADKHYIEAVAEDLLRWARVPDVLTIEEFYDYIAIEHDTLNDWSKKYACIKKSLSRANVIIGARREVGLIKKDYDKYVASTLHNYLPRCKASDSYHSKLKQEEEGNSNKIIYVRGDRFPNSPLVPDLTSPDLKKDKDE